MNREEANKKLRERRKLTNNAVTKKYEKTYKGFLVRLYRNMESRVKGIQKEKFHLYKDKELIERNVFYEWALNNPTFYSLFEEYKNSQYSRKLAPSVDRINPKEGYKLENMEFVTMSENSRRSSITRLNKI